MKQILVPTDFSNYSDNALEYAVQLAAQSNRSVQLLHIVDYGSHLGSLNKYDAQMVTAIQDGVKKDTEEKLEALIAKYAKPNVTIEATHVAGLFLDILRKKTEPDSTVDLIVMGSKGATGLEELIFGSNAERVIRFAEVPVIVIGKKEESNGMKNIVVVADFDEEVGPNFSKVLDLANDTNATIHLLRVNTPQYFYSTGLADKKMDQFIEQWGLSNVTKNQWNHVQKEQAIIEFCNKINADLIVMGTHGRKGIAHAFYGSMAEDLANHEATPILTYKLASAQKSNDPKIKNIVF